MVDRQRERETTGNEPDPLDAFICYSRRDVDFCRALERALERWSPPKGLPGGGRRLRVFRDEDDIAGPDYYEAIERFLARSRKLIVVCSPSARASTYTNDEIRRFVRLHSAGDVVVLLAAGVPNNEATSEQQSEKAFPDALYEVMEMPLATSFAGFDPSSDRVDRGRFRDAWYTLLATLLDADRSVVEQRDLRRARRRRNAWATAGSVLAMALLGLTTWALQERGQARVAEAAAQDSARVAQEQRAEAETQRILALAAEKAAEDSAKVAQEQRAEAQTQRAEAEAQRAEAEAQRTRAVNRLLAAQASELFATDPALLPRAMLLSVEALRGGGDEVAAGLLRKGLASLSRPRSEFRPSYQERERLEEPDDLWGAVCRNTPFAVEVTVPWASRFARVRWPDGTEHLVVHGEPITRCAFLDDGTLVTWSGDLENGFSEPFDGDKTVRIWDPPPPIFGLSSEAAVDAGTVATAFEPARGLLAASRHRDGIRIFDLRTGRAVAALQVEGGHTVSDLAFSADGRFLASAQVYGSTFDVWAVDGFRKVASLPGSTGEGRIDIAPDGRYVATTEGELIGQGKGAVWEVGSGEPLPLAVTDADGIRRPRLTPDGTRAVTLNRDRLTVFDLATGSELASLDDVQGYAFGPDFMAVLDRSGRIGRWSLAPDEPPRPITHMEWFELGCFEPGPAGRFIAVCGPEGVLLHDARTGRRVRALAQSDRVSTVGFSADGSLLAGASYDYGGQAMTGLDASNTLRIWDVTTGAVLASLAQPGLVRKLSFSPGGSFLASTVHVSEESGYAPANVWLWRHDALVREACRSLHRNLTLEEWRTYMPPETPYRATCPELPPLDRSPYWGQVLAVGRSSGAIELRLEGGSPSGVGCGEMVARTGAATRSFTTGSPGRWAPGGLGDVAEGDSVWLYADNGPEDDCPTRPLAVDLLVRLVPRDGDDGMVEEQREAVAALLTPGPSWESQQADEAAREPWDRVRRAGVCESEASRDAHGGVRTLYCSLRRAGVLDWFVEDAPVPVFLDGPHEGAELDLEAESFGHYNPDFVRWAAGRLIPGPDRTLTRAAARLAYEPWRHVGRSYYLALEHLEANPSVEAGLRDALLEATDASGVLWGAALEELREESWANGRDMDVANPEWIPSITTVAAGFWIRRGIDGSRPAFRQALSDLLEVVDPDFLAERRAAEGARQELPDPDAPPRAP